MSTETIKQKIILPGELFLSTEPYIISTLLGSCVSVTLFNKKYKFGGMNHYMLDKSANASYNDNKYGNNAIRNLIEKMKAADPDLKNVEAKIFGGGNVVDILNGVEIGKNNAQIARRILNENSIPVVNEFVNKDFGLKINFNNTDHSVIVAKIQKTVHSNKIEINKKIDERRFNENIKIIIYSADWLFKNYLIKWIESKHGVYFAQVNTVEDLVNSVSAVSFHKYIIIADFNLLNYKDLQKLQNNSSLNGVKLYLKVKESETVNIPLTISIKENEYNSSNFKNYFNRKIELL